MKKLLSIILVLAMLLGMASVGAFADGETPTLSVTGTYSKILINGTTTLTATPANATNATYTWVSGSTDVATVPANSTGTTVVVTGKAEGTAIITCSMLCTESPATAITKTYTVKVQSNGTTCELTDDSAKLSQIIQYPGTTTLTPYLKVNGSKDTDLTNDATITFAVQSGPSVTVGTSTGVVTATSTPGTSTVRATATLGGTTLGSVDYTITVSNIQLSYDVKNGDYETISAEKLYDALEDEIKSQNSGVSVDITNASIKRIGDGRYGKLTIGTSTTEVTSSTGINTNSITFTATKGAIGEAEYEITAGGYTGTVTFNVTPYEEIDKEVDAKFTHEEFYLDVPSELYYMKEVNSSSAFSGVYTSSGMTKYDAYKFKVSEHTLTNGKITLYVVGLDNDGYAYCGTITVNNADYDLKYIGEEDVETSFVGKDFEDLYEAIFEETNTSDNAYVEFTGVTFTYNSSNKDYNLYNNGSEMTTTKLKTVDEDDIDDVTVEPLKSGDFYITATLNGKYYKNDKASGSNNPYTIVILVSAVSGDVEYSVVSGSYVYLNEDDFQNFVEDELTSKALLNYIVIDDSDLNTSKEGYFTLSSSKVVDLDGEKLYFETSKSTEYEISEARFVAAKLAANGTKIYVPFTAYGSKTGAENGKTELAKGYIQFEVANNPFTDIAKTDYFYEPVLWATAKGITKGTNAAGTLFSPAQGCTRAQVVTFLYRAAGSPSVTSSMKAEVAKFTDVNSTKHKDFIDAIAWAKYYGITSGTSATTFGPDKTCTRAQIVTFIANYVNKVEGKSVTPIYSNQFTDVKTTTTHKAYAAAIQWAVEKGITKGTNAAGTLFSPDATCTRGQVVTFLYNYFK